MMGDGFVFAVLRRVTYGTQKGLVSLRVLFSLPYLFFMLGMRERIVFLRITLGYIGFPRKIHINRRIPREPLNKSDFCDKRLKYRGFYCKNNMKSEASQMTYSLPSAPLVRSANVIPSKKRAVIS